MVLKSVKNEKSIYKVCFWENFKFLLKEGIDINIYQEVDYRNNPVEYCGMQITDSPLKRGENKEKNKK